MPAEAAEKTAEKTDNLSTFDGFVNECRLMLRFLRESHRDYDAGAALTVMRAEDTSGSPPSKKDVIDAHRSLLKAIDPATPNTLKHYYSHRDTGKRPRFTEPFMLRLMVLTLVILLVFIALSLDPEVTGLADIAKEHGRVLFLNELYLAFAAALGAIFSALFMADQYVSKAAFDPSRAVNYWVRILLGIVAGLMLSVLLYDQFADVSVSDGAVVGGFGQALLAMLGGFSAPAVYEILERFVDTLRSAIRGSGEDIAKANYDNKLAGEGTRNAEQLAAMKQQHTADIQQIVSRLQQVQETETLPQGVKDLVSDLNKDKLQAD